MTGKSQQRWSYDAWTAAAVVAELRALIIPGRVQQVLQTDPNSYALEIYANRKRRYLFVSADPQWATAQLWPEKLRRGVDAPSPLLLQMRKRLRGAALLSVEQPPFERLLRFRFEHPGEGISFLVAEVMGRRANLLLLDGDDRILSAVKQVSLGRNRRRSTLPGTPYTPPPPMNRPLPWQLQPEMLAGWLADAPPEPLWRLLVQHLAGISPLLAREIVCRAGGKQDSIAANVDPADVMVAMGALLARWSDNTWQPTLAFADGEIAAAAPYPLHCWDETTAAESMSDTLARWRQSIGRGDPYRAQRAAVAGQLAAARRKTRRLQANLQRELAAAVDIQRWRQMGDWVLTLATQIQPGQQEIRAATENGTLVIPLDSALSPSENAQRYYRRYRKGQRAAKQIPPRLRQVEIDLAYLDQLAVDLAQAENAPQIAEVGRAVAVLSRGTTGQKKTKASAGPRRFRTEEGFLVSVGRNARQNEQITFHKAVADDTWFHARNLPGAHVILHNAGRPVSEETRQHVADLAAYFSSGRQDAKIEVQTCRVRDLKRMPGGHPGQVILRREEVLLATPRLAATLQRIDS